jgi:hypothetical protein
LIEKKHTYQSDILALPPLTMVLSQGTEKEPEGKSRLLQAFGKDKSEAEAKKLVKKLIGHLQNSEK